MSQEAEPDVNTGDGDLPVIPADNVDLEPGPNTRGQLRLAGRTVDEHIQLPTRKRKVGPRHQSLPSARGPLRSQSSQGDLPVFSPTTPGLAWEDDPELPQLNSTLREAAGPPTAGPSSGRSNQTFNFSGISQLSHISQSKAGLWLTTQHQNRVSQLSSVDSFQAAVNAAHLETSLLSTDDEVEFQEAIDQPLPQDKSLSPPKQPDQASEPPGQASEPSEQALGPSDQPSGTPDPIQGPSDRPSGPPSEPSEPSEPSDHP